MSRVTVESLSLTPPEDLWKYAAALDAQAAQQLEVYRSILELRAEVLEALGRQAIVQSVEAA